MGRKLLCLLLLLGAPACHAQFIGYTSPQSVLFKVLTAQSTPQTVNVPNLGQNVHWLNYTVALNGGTMTALDIRFEGSNDGINFFTVSDDATDLSQGEIYFTGLYAVVRVNLVVFSINAGAPTITATYSGTSSVGPIPLGLVNPSQSNRKLIFFQLPQNANQGPSPSIPAPFGSTLGFLLINAQTTAIPGGSSVTVTASNTQAGFNISLALLPNAGTQIVAVPNYPASTVQTTYVSGGAAAGTFTLTYVFMSPHLPNGLMGAQIQSPLTLNSETTSALNTAITKTLNPLGSPAAVRIHLYAVSARCSAGTAQLTVTDGATQIWSTAATEVTTTTFRFQWNPGLASLTSNGMTITLSTCGAANTGVLDLQASQF